VSSELGTKWVPICIRSARFHDLCHTFGTGMAAVGVALRTLQEWMGHRDFKTTLIYANYQPGAEEAALVEKAFSDSRWSTSTGRPARPKA
jgi:integrase